MTKATRQWTKIGSKIGVKNRRKIDPGEPPGFPKCTQNRCRERLWGDQSAEGAPSDDPERPPCAPRSPRERLESPQARTRASGRAPGSALGRSKSMPRRFRERKERVFCMCRACAPFTERLFNDLFRLSDFRKMQKRSKVPRLPVKIKVRPFALRGEALARCDLEKHQKSTQKSIRKH